MAMASSSKMPLVRLIAFIVILQNTYFKVFLEKSNDRCFNTESPSNLQKTEVFPLLILKQASVLYESYDLVNEDLRISCTVM